MGECDRGMGWSVEERGKDIVIDRLREDERGP